MNNVLWQLTTCTELFTSLLRMTLFHDLLCPPISHHGVCRVATAHNVNPVKPDDWNASGVCLSHAHPTQNTASTSHEISTLDHGLRCNMPRYTYITHSRPRWNTNLHILL